MNHYFKFIISLIIPQIVGGIGALFTLSSVESWYGELTKPSFTPPSWIFGPAWTILYILMGISLFLIWKSAHPLKDKAIWLFAIQLFLNGIWSPAFFGLQSPILGLLIIIPLWIMIWVCIGTFYNINRTASYLFVPYLIWVSFAMALNASIWYLN